MPSLTLTSLTQMRNSPWMVSQGDVTNQLRAKNRKQKILLIVLGHVLRRLDSCPHSALIAWGKWWIKNQRGEKKGHLASTASRVSTRLGQDLFWPRLSLFWKRQLGKDKELCRILDSFSLLKMLSQNQASMGNICTLITFYFPHSIIFGFFSDSG